MARVDTTVAMALGASVAPLTMMTPMLRSVTANNSGFCISSERKSVHSMVTRVLSIVARNSSQAKRIQV